MSTLLKGQIMQGRLAEGAKSTIELCMGGKRERTDFVVHKKDHDLVYTSTNGTAISS